MKISESRSGKTVRERSAFSIIEATVGIGVFGVIFCAFCTGLTSSFSVVGAARETLRATQIMSEKLDTLRLYDWDDITNNLYIPRTFQAAFYPTNGLNAGTSPNDGTTYSGTITITNAPLTTEDYTNDVKMVVIDLAWQRGLITRRAQMSTLFSRYGMQVYSIY